MGKLNSTVSRRRLVLGGLWVTAAAAQWAALRPVLAGEHADPPVVLYHVLGASFAVCGLLALYRRPDGWTGRLMVVTDSYSFARPVLNRVDASLAQTVGVAIGNYWVIAFVALLVSFPNRTNRWGRSERVLIGAFVFAEVVLVLAWMLFAAFPGNLLLVSANAGVAEELNRQTG